MGVLDVILGRDQNGKSSKINMALIALLLWRWYQASGRAGGAQPAPAPRGSGGPMPQPRRVEARRTPPPDEDAPLAPSGSGGELGDLLDSVKRMPQGGAGRRGRGRGRSMDDEEMDEGPDGPGGGGLGDILGEILRGGRGGGMPPGGPRGPGGGRGGGGLGDILGEILGGGRGPGPARMAAQQGGGSINDLIPGGLGGLLAGGAAGGALGDLMQQFEAAGQGEAARSWVGRGENVPVTPKEIEKTFGSDIITQLAAQFDMPKDELLAGLSETLPKVVDQLTPDGRLPTPEEISRRA